MYKWFISLFCFNLLHLLFVNILCVFFFTFFFLWCWCNDLIDIFVIEWYIALITLCDLFLMFRSSIFTSLAKLYYLHSLLVIFVWLIAQYFKSWHFAIILAKYWPYIFMKARIRSFWYPHLYLWWYAIKQRIGDRMP